MGMIFAVSHDLRQLISKVAGVFSFFRELTALNNHATLTYVNYNTQVTFIIHFRIPSCKVILELAIGGRKAKQNVIIDTHLHVWEADNPRFPGILWHP